MTSPNLLELVAIEGEDRGRRFPLREGELRLGRRREGEQNDDDDVILFDDRSVSSVQAFLRCSADRIEIEHRPGATNPTRINGEEIERRSLRPGDRIQLGNLVLELSDPSVTATVAVDRRQLAGPATLFVPPQGGATVIRPPVGQKTELVLVTGIAGLEGRSFPFQSPGTTRLGRHESCEVMLPEPGVSRLHAELEWRGRELWLHHRSGTNATHLNDDLIDSSARVHHGDRILLANHVLLEVVAPTAGERPVAAAPVAEEEESLQDIMEKLVSLDQKVSERFVRTGSFLDIDVVDSYGMKARAERPEHIIVSFERFRAWAIETTNGFSGRLLNSNGDELMIFFESALDGVRAASAVLQRLDEFNQQKNLLADPFRVRAGLHSGTSAVDLTRGVAYSPVLDVAGHLQKQATVNGLLISEVSFKELPEGLPFAPAGKLEKEQLPTYRLTAPLP